MEENPGTGISNRTSKWEREDYERIIKNWKPRGTHTLGIIFKDRSNEKGRETETSSTEGTRGSTE